MWKYKEKDTKIVHKFDLKYYETWSSNRIHNTFIIHVIFGSNNMMSTIILHVSEQFLYQEKKIDFIPVEKPTILTCRHSSLISFTHSV